MNDFVTSEIPFPPFYHAYHFDVQIDPLRNVY